MKFKVMHQVPIVHTTADASRLVRRRGIVGRLACMALPFYLAACGTAGDDTPSEPSINNAPNSPNAGNGPNTPSSDGQPGPAGNPEMGAMGAGMQPIPATPPAPEQPNLMPTLQPPSGATGSGNSGGGGQPVPAPPGTEDPPAGEDPPSEDPPSEDPPAGEPDGETRPAAANEVLLIGDSYLEIPNQEFNRELSRLARAAGMIGANESYRDNAISGTRLAGGFSPIPSQYANAQAQAPAKVVVMDGGGNDILQGGCTSGNCAAVSNAVAAARTLFQQIDSDGTVEEIIFFYYPDFPNFPALRADAMDVMRPQLQSICETSPVHCTFLDLRPLFVGHPEFTGPDNLHPSVLGSRTTAGAVFEILQANPIAR